MDKVRSILMERSEIMANIKKHPKNKRPILNHRGSLRKSRAPLPLLYGAPKEQQQAQMQEDEMKKPIIYRSKRHKGKRIHTKRPPVNPTAIEHDFSRSTPIQRNEKETSQESNRAQHELIQAKVVYAEGIGQSMMQVSLLEEIWDVEWVHALRVPWKQNWNEVECHSKIEVHHIRHDDHKKVIWIAGDLEIKALGTTVQSQKLQHETIRIPFTSTVLRPSLPTAKVVTSAIPPRVPACPADRWVEAGDWQITLIADPLMNTNSGCKKFSGLASISGRVWWYRKQLVPVCSPYITSRVNSTR